MCGIAGCLLLPDQSPNLKMLALMASAIAHRGPDGSGEFLTDHAALLHLRLSIIDLETGAQPLRDGPLTLIANGEIYNYLELKEVNHGNYKTASDCEPPLKLFARQADRYTEPLRGMYAIAIHDHAFDTLTLSRDLFGIKPLYYAHISSGLFFASEPQALLAAGLPRVLDRVKLGELLTQQFCTSTETIFAGITRLAPGETITVKDGEITTRTCLKFPRTETKPRTEAEALIRLDAVLQTSVDLHQRSDVPYGMFLSGGIDSAVILALMARLNSVPVLAYTAGFDVPSFVDERDAAAATAKAAGARHERLSITKKMVWEHLPEIVACMDDPVADYAIIPTWFLARRAREDVKVILSGEGGDEMFAGYGRYRAAARLLLPKPMRRRGVFDRLDVLREPLPPPPQPVVPRQQSRLKTAQLQDIAEWLPNDLLLKLDRCLMAHAIEGRTPFIDTGVAAFAFALPDKFLVRNGLGKHILRLWLEQHLPAAQPFAKKQGFDVPIGAWIAAEPRLGELVAKQPIITELAEPARVRALFARAAEKRAGFAAWVLLFTALWHRRHIRNKPVVGNVFETLSDV